LRNDPSLVDSTEYYNNLLTRYALEADGAMIPPQKDRMTMIHYENSDKIMELVTEAQERLLYANVSRANRTVWTHWGATVRTLSGPITMGNVPTQQDGPDELTQFCRKCGKEHREEDHAMSGVRKTHPPPQLKDTTASCTGSKQN